MVPKNNTMNDDVVSVLPGTIMLTPSIGVDE